MVSRSLSIQCMPGVVGTHLNLPVSEDAADAAIEASSRKHRCNWVGQVQYSLHHRCHILETWETFTQEIPFLHQNSGSQENPQVPLPEVSGKYSLCG